MLDKYITIKDKPITCGQTSNGIWYCKELPAETVKELDVLIGEINQILNKYNNKQETKKSKKPILTKNVKGLD